MGQYLPVFAMLVLAVIFGALSLVVSKLLAPSRSTAAKRAPYECGVTPGRSVPERFPVQFYVVAMIFIVFDIEIILLFPWAVIYRDIGAFGLGAIALFTAPVFIGLLYEISTGTFSWGERLTLRRTPVERAVTPEAVSEGRTAQTTVRRVGLEGREKRPEEVAA